jgi:hypothetical protein
LLEVIEECSGVHHQAGGRASSSGLPILQLLTSRIRLEKYSGDETRKNSRSLMHHDQSNAAASAPTKSTYIANRLKHDELVLLDIFRGVVELQFDKGNCKEWRAD